jgi:hypothetical protein
MSMRPAEVATAVCAIERSLALDALFATLVDAIGSGRPSWAESEPETGRRIIKLRTRLLRIKRFSE